MLLPRRMMDALAEALPDADCPVALAVQTIGGKWKMLVLRALLLRGPQRYNRLLESVVGVSAKELTRNLRELETAGLLTRTLGSDRQTSYALTALGAQLMPAFRELIPFGERLQATRQQNGSKHA
ncbi:MAG: winged helix-turn-helix transcriptional regulator [Myxococcaceae bacterium]